MLLIALRKTTKNLWLSICLLSGFILAVAVTCSIPMYAGSAPLKQLSKEFVQLQKESGKYPAYWSASLQFTHKGDKDSTLKQQYDTFLNKTQSLKKKVTLPLLGTADTISVKNIAIGEKVNKFNLDAFAGLERYAAVKYGRMYSGKNANGVYEAVVTENDMLTNKLILGKTYFVPSAESSSLDGTGIKIVGIIETAAAENLAWYESYPFNRSSNTFYMDYELMKKDFILSGQLGIPILISTYNAYDYRKINSSELMNILQSINSWNNAGKDVSFQSPIKILLENYKKQEKTLLYTMFVLSIPILFVILVLICMVLYLIVEYDRNEISVITSRGGSRAQVIMIYLLQGIILSVVALAAGPPAGVLICRMIGASGAFMDLGYDASMPLTFNSRVFVYALATVLFYLFAMLVSSAAFSCFSIVQYKQKRVRSSKSPVILGIAASFALIGLSLYWRFTNGKTYIAFKSGETISSSTPVDPLLVMNAVMFITGIAIVFLLLFPYFINLIFLMGKRIWSPLTYLAFVQTSRNRDMKQLFMLFFILAFSVGIFNSNTARTINRNAEDNIRYKNGADLVLMEDWNNYDPDMPDAGTSIAAAFGDPIAIRELEMYDYREKAGMIRTIYTEPDFSRFVHLEGVISAARVFHTMDATADFSQTAGAKSSGGSPRISVPVGAAGVEMLGINTREFGNTAWFRGNLLPAGWYGYLNLLGEKPDAVLLSSSFEQELGVKRGDTITLSFSNTDHIKVKVTDFIKYWPGFEPVDDTGKANYLAVVNLGYIQASTPLRPYQVWLKTDPAVSAETVINELITDRRIVHRISDTGAELNNKLQEPVFQGINGVLTLGLVLVLIISIAGFLIYWLLSIKRRELQFGILRSFGIGFRSILGMLALEQILTSFASVLGGILIGQLATTLFIPLMGITYHTAGQPLPFLITLNRDDYIRFYVISFIMLLAALLILGKIISRIRIAQVIKLGEE